MLNISDFYKVPSINVHKIPYNKWNDTKNNIKNTEEKFVGKTYTYFHQIINFCGHKHMPVEIRKQANEIIPTIINGLNALHTLIEIVSTADMDGYREEKIRKEESDKKRKLAITNLNLALSNMEDETMKAKLEEFINDMSKAA